MNHFSLGLSFFLGFLIFLFIFPIPAFLVDWLLLLNMTFSLLLLFVAIHIEKPSDFSALPFLLLVATLFLLGLNLTTTRLILSQSGEQGLMAAGKVVYTFGEFMSRGSLLLGLVLFSLILVIHYFVITKGADRISEVIARFTLDGLPGRQLGLDREYTQGGLTLEEVRRAKKEVIREANFFASMDGVLKYIAGDALASLLITVVNLAGGFLVGILAHKMPLYECGQTFGKLTIGDGLTSLIPSFLNALSVGIVVSRVGEKRRPFEDLSSQLFSHPQPLWSAAFALLILLLTPLPKLPLLTFAALFFYLGYLQKGDSTRKKSISNILELTQVDTVEIQLGFRLIQLADERRGGQLPRWIGDIRRRLAEEMGILLPPVSVRDNIQLPAKSYVIRIRGNVLAKGKLHPDKLFAVNPGGEKTLPFFATPTKEPILGFEGYWIPKEKREEAEALGFQTFAPSSVLAHHFREVILGNMDKILTRSEVIQILERARAAIPDLVQQVLEKERISLRKLKAIFQELLREQIPLLDMETILETSLELSDLSPMAVAEELRRRLIPRVVDKFLTSEKEILLLKVSPSLELLLLKQRLSKEEEEELGRKLQQEIHKRGGHPLLCRAEIRRYLSQILQETGRFVHVFSHRELAGVQIRIVGEVNVDWNQKVGLFAG